MEQDEELAAIRARMLARMSAPPSNSAPAKPVVVTQEGFEAFVRAHGVAVVDVWAEWCGPCRIIGPIVDEVARELSGQVAFGKLDADTSPGILEAFRIQGIPTLLVFRNGKLVDTLVGAMPKSQLASAIRRHLPA